MKQNLHSWFIICAFIISLCFSTIGKAQSPTFNCYITNDVFISPTNYQFDIYLLRTGTDPFEYAAGQFGIVLNSACLNSGVLVPSIVSGSCQLTNTIQCAASIQTPVAASTINIQARIPPGSGSGSLISNVRNGCTAPGTRLITIQFNSSIPFACQCMNPSFNFTPALNQNETKIFAYVGGVNTDITANGTFYDYSSPGTCVVHCGSNGVGELKGFNPVVVYPNPATGEFTVYGLQFTARVSMLNVYNALGENIYSRSLSAGNSKQETVNCKQFAAGLYFVKVEDGEDVWLGRFVKE